MGEYGPERRRNSGALTCNRCGHQSRIQRVGPRKYDPRHHVFDGTNLLLLNTPSLPIILPPIYGLQGVGFGTVSGDGPMSYWNSYVAAGQMGGRGNFSDPRIGIDHASAGSRYAEIASALSLSTEFARARTSGGQFRSAGRKAR
jgi:hypothetical protein